MRTGGRWARLNPRSGYVRICPVAVSLGKVRKNARNRTILNEEPTNCDPLWTTSKRTLLQSWVVEELRGREQTRYTAKVIILVAKFTAVAEDRFHSRVYFVLGVSVSDVLERG